MWVVVHGLLEGNAKEAMQEAVKVMKPGKATGLDGVAT